MATLLEIKQQIIAQMDSNGLYLWDTDNAILFTVEFYLLCKAQGILDADDAPRLRKALDSLRTKDANGNVIPGLYNKRINSNDQINSHDNYVATVCSVVLGSEFVDVPSAVDDYGRAHFYFYNNVNPGQFNVTAFMQPSEWALYRICAGRSPGVIPVIWFYGMVFINYFGQNANPQVTSEKLLDWIGFQAVGGKWYMQWIQNYRLAKMKQEYPNGIQDTFKSYFGTGLLVQLAEGITTW